MTQDKQALYDDISHEFDEQVSYKFLPQFPNAYVFTRKELRSSSYETEYPDILEKLCALIRESSIWSDEDNVYIIKEDTLTNILENFYLHGKDVE